MKKLLRGLVCLLAACIALGGGAVGVPGQIAVASATAELVGAADADRVAAVRAAIPAWTLAPTTRVATALPAVGSASVGNSSVLVEAPSVDGPVIVLSQSIDLRPDTGYQVSIDLRSYGEGVEAGAVALRIGGTTVELGPLGEDWTTFSFDVRSWRQPALVSLDVVLLRPVAALGVDDARVTAEGGGSLLRNGSFEQLDAPSGVVNDRLVMSTEWATMALSADSGRVEWEVRRADDDSVVEHGDSEAPAGVRSIPLAGLTQGYYRFSAALADGTSVAVPFALVDMPGLTLRPDARLGVGAHVEATPWYDDTAKLAAAVGIGEVRNDLLWHLNERREGTYSFAPAYTAAAERLRAQGIDLLAILSYANPLYDDGGTPHSSEGLAAFGAYARAVAEQFELSGVEVYNEFNISSQSTSPCGRGPECYLPLLEAVHRAFVAAEIDTPIAAGATSLYDAQWFRELWRLGAAEHADAMSFHPYEIALEARPPDEVASVIHASRTDAESAGVDELPVWITEIGWTTHEGGASASLQAQAIVKSLLAARAAGAAKVLWYDLIDDSYDSSDPEGNFGLYFRPTPGVSANAPKQAAFAQALLASQVSGRELTDYSTAPDGCVAAQFTGSDVLTIVWSTGRQSQVTLSTATPVIVVAFDGSRERVVPQGGAVRITIGEEPQFVSGVAECAT